MDYVELDPVTVTKAVVPLTETQSLTSFSKKGEAQASIHVVSDAQTGEVDRVVFQDKKHTDVFDVSVGMSVKEMKKLRKDIKKMRKHGKFYYYTDSSQIMYVVDAQDMEAEATDEGVLNEMNVEAIVWKNKKKKHGHKKDKKK